MAVSDGVDQTVEILLDPADGTNTTGRDKDSLSAAAKRAAAGSGNPVAAAAGGLANAVVTITSNNQAAAAGLVSHWKFDEGSGTTAADSGNSTNNGLLAGAAAWSAGRYGTGLEFVNGGSYMSAGVAGFSFTQGTIAFWYKPNYNTNNTAGVTHELLTVGPYTYTPGGIRIFNNREYQDIRITHNGGGADLLSGTDLLANQWYHIVYTWNSATGSRNYYLNSLLNKTASVAPWTPVTTPKQIYIGKAADSAAVANGTLDDVRIYSVVLSPAEVRSLYVQSPGSVQFTSGAYSVNEDAGAVTIAVSRVNGASGAATVSYAVTDGSATAGQDYTAATGTLSWADGDTADKTFTIPITVDTSAEGSETFSVALTNANGVALGSPISAVVTILDRTPGNLKLSSGTYSVNEDGGAVTITVSRANGSTGPASVNYATTDGTAIAGQDYTAVSGTLSWADGDTADKTFTIPVTADSSPESNETLNIALSNAMGATLGSPAAAVVTILDRSPGSLKFSSATYTAGEGAGTITISVSRVNGATGAASVAYATSDGTALAGQDYTAISGTLSWADGDTSVRTFQIGLSDDTAIESNETINLLLTNAVGAGIGDPAAAVVTITDNDTAVPAGLVSWWKLDEAAGQTTRDSGNSNNSATLAGGTAWTAGRYNSGLEFVSSGSYLSAGLAGFNFAEGSIAFWYRPNYSTNNTVGVPHDILNVGPYTYTPGNIRIFNNREYQDIRITHNGGGADILSTTDLLANQWYHIVYTWNTVTGAKRYYLDSVLNKAVDVAPWTPATAPRQIFVGKSGDVAAGANGKIDEIRIYSFALTPTQVQNLYTQSPGTLRFSTSTYSVNEDAGSLTVTVSRVNGATGPASVNYSTSNGTAQAGQDYTSVAGTLVWADGDASDRTFTVPITNDAFGEPLETLNVALSNATGALLGSPASAAVNIVDRSPGNLRFSTATFTILRSTGSGIIGVARVNGAAGAASVNFATSDGTALAGQDYTAVAGTLSWADGDAAEKTFTVPVAPNATPDTTLNVTLTNAAGTVLGSPASAVVTIVEHSPGTLKFSSGAYTVNEDAGTVTLTVARVNGLTGAASVNYATSDGTAVAGQDYVSASGTLSWADGDAADKTFTVAINTDSASESGETLNVTLTNATGAAVGSPETTVVTIVDRPSALPGVWSSLINFPNPSGCANCAFDPIHMHLLPNGKILMFQDDNPSGTRGSAARTVAYSWDVASNVFTSLDNITTDMFCSGHAFLPDGTLMVVGGHNQSDSNGTTTTNFFDFTTNSWTLSPFRMNQGRWYPTVTTLGNGEMLVVSGDITTTQGVNTIPEVWQTNNGGGWRQLTSAALAQPLYPWMHVTANGKVFNSGPDPLSRYLTTSGTGAWTSVANHLFQRSRDYGSSVMYDDGKVLVMGGGNPPTNLAEVIDLNSATPAWQPTGSMAWARRMTSATILPDGSILAIGGTSSSGFNDATLAVLPAEIWSPATNTWAVKAPMQVPRMYHSNTLLLPDGRVVSAGGGRPSPVGSTDQPNAQIYSPPYLFKADGSPAERPVITSVPTELIYGQSFQIATPNAASVSAVSMIRIGSFTHSFDQNQRINRLPFTASNGLLTATVPINRNSCPPGHYMLFILTNGVPSVATIVRVHE